MVCSESIWSVVSLSVARLFIGVLFFVHLFLFLFGSLVGRSVCPVCLVKLSV